MKIFQNRSRPESQHEFTSDEADHAIVKGINGPYSDETSFSWRGKDQDYRSLSDSHSGTAVELASSDTLPIRTLAINEGSAHTVNDGAGMDPYNSGRFDASKL